MQVELTELRKLANGRVDDAETGQGNTPRTPPTATPLGPPQSVSSLTVWPTTSTAGTQPATTLLSGPEPHGYCIVDKYICDIHLAASYVNELFRIYFTRCHPHLPFTMNQSIEAIHDKCPMLFWVICAVASPKSTRSKFESPVRALVSNVLDPSMGYTVETVQALLILCTWPFAFANQKTDASFMYSGIATQISLSLGLHRPTMDPESKDATSDDCVDEKIRRTTWLACFIVTQIQASRRGVPATVIADCSLLSCLDNPTLPQALCHLCSIAHLTVEAAHALGVRGSDTSGLVEPSARISLINVFARQFDDLQRRRFPKPTDIVEIFFLSSRLQLWSFALHTDITVSANSIQIIQQARDDAVHLIQIACEKNLSLVPFYTRRSVCYAALVLCRIKLGPYDWRDSMIDHHVGRAQQALAGSEGVEFGQFIAAVSSPDNRDVYARTTGGRYSPYRSRLSAFLVLEFQRVYAELQRAKIPFPSDFLDLDTLHWMGYN
jgi:hypothetical protein